MKKLFITAVLLIAFGFSGSFAQTVNGTPLKDIDVDYVQIVGKAKAMSAKVTVDIDFGQENSYWTNKDTQINDENGNKIVFNSMIDALNFMSKNGYEFVTAYTVTLGNQNVYHYLMNKKKE